MTRPRLGATFLRFAEETPPSRDRYVDFLRGFSIAVVVLGHWLIAVVLWRDGMVDGVNALEVIDGLWIVTWLLQVMPLFFFVGGFSNLRSWDGVVRRGGDYAQFLHGRIVRMMRPTVVFLAVGLAITTVLDAANVADNAVSPASQLITRPLWFLGVYMIVVALAPIMVALHRRFGVRVLLVMAGVAIAVDVLRFAFDVTVVGYLNFPVVWLLAHQLGFFYADRALNRAPWRLAIPAVGALALLVNFGPYPGSMVGLSRDEVSNMDPPTIAIVALTIWQVGLAMWLRGPITRWLQRLRVWAGVIFVNSVIMTMFLWHLSAMLIAIGILYPLGFPQPEAGSLQWWALRPVWVAVLLVLLAGFVLVFGRYEQRFVPSRPTVAPTSAAVGLTAALGSVFVVLGVLGFAIGGLHQLFSTTGTELIVFNLNPFQNVIHLLLGGLLLRSSVRSPQARRVALEISVITLVGLLIAGFAMTGGSVTNYLAANTADNVLHGAAAILALLVLRRASSPAHVVGSL